MAEGNSVLFEQLQSEVTCPLCLEIFTDPKKLPCDHVYCTACLHGLALRSIAGLISCPECRRSIPIPSNGVTDFSTPCQVNRLIEMYQGTLKCTERKATIQQPSLQPPCELHSSQTLALYCETCGKLVCRDCALTSCAKKNHEHGFIDDMIKKYKSDLSGEIEPMREVSREIESALKAISASEEKLLTEKEAKLREVM